MPLVVELIELHIIVEEKSDHFILALSGGIEQRCLLVFVLMIDDRSILHHQLHDFKVAISAGVEERCLFEII